MPISFLRRASRFRGVSGHLAGPGTPTRNILVYPGMLSGFVPSWSQIMQNSYLVPISFRSRSDLVLDADHALDFSSNLVFQACISFCSVSDKSGASLFLPCLHTNAVAHINLGIVFGHMPHYKIFSPETIITENKMLCRSRPGVKTNQAQ